MAASTAPERAMGMDRGAGQVWALREGQVWMSLDPDGIAGVDSRSTPGLGLDDEGHYNLLSKWGSFRKNYCGKISSRDAFVSKDGTLIAVLQQAGCEGKWGRVVPVPEGPGFSSCLSWSLVSSLALGTSRTL